MTDMFRDLEEGWDALLAIRRVDGEINDPTNAHKELTPPDIAQRELERGFPFAVERLVKIAMYSPDDKIARLAANDVIHHNFMLAKIRNESSEKDSLRSLVEGVSEDDMTEIRRQVEQSKALPMQDDILPPVGPFPAGGTGAPEDYDG